jgi:hypothetical protein
LSVYPWKKLCECVGPKALMEVDDNILQIVGDAQGIL